MGCGMGAIPDSCVAETPIGRRHPGGRRRGRIPPSFIDEFQVAFSEPPDRCFCRTLPYNGVMGKRCAKCERVLPPGAFYKMSAARDGLQSWCKDCMRQPSPVYEPRLCLGCGELFVPSKANHVLCSQRCAQRVSRKRHPPKYVPRRFEKPCERCGKSTLNRRFCSERCAYLAAHPPRTCAACGRSFGKRGRRCEVELCPSCKEARREVLRAEREALKKRRPVKVRTKWVCWLGKRPEPRVFVAGACASCGESFVGWMARDDRFCSKICRKRAERQARRVGLGGERIYRRKVFERDDWTCRLCLKPVDRDAVVPAPLAPTLDHVVPLSLGGEHVFSNVQCAHFICNSTKSDNVVQLRFAA